jgi:hypothetical protein
MPDQDNKCYACGKKLGKNPALVDTRDEQLVYVGRECLKLIKQAGEQGYQPPQGGPRLYLCSSPPSEAQG